MSSVQTFLAFVVLVTAVITEVHSASSIEESSAAGKLVPTSIGQFLNLKNYTVETSDDASKDVDEEDLENWVAPSEILKKYPYYMSGFDDENRPIWVAEIGKFNVRKLVEEGGENFRNFDKFVKQAAMRVIKSLKLRSTEDEPVKEAVFISDMDELNIIQLAHVPTIAYVLNLAREYRDLIVQNMNMCFIINVNFAGETVINLVKPIFGRVFEKVEVYGNNKAKYVPALLRRIPQDQLPEWYGGLPNFKPVQIYG